MVQFTVSPCSHVGLDADGAVLHHQELSAVLLRSSPQTLFPAAGLSLHAPDVTPFVRVNNSSHCEVLAADLITSCNTHLPPPLPRPLEPCWRGERRPAAAGVWRALDGAE